MAGCPLPPDAPAFMVSVANHGGALVDSTTRMRIAAAIAGEWGHRDDREPLPTARYYAIMQELYTLAPNPRPHTFGKWKPRPADSAVARLTYRRGMLPEFDVLGADRGNELHAWSAIAAARAIATAARRVAPPDWVLPLAVTDADSAILEVRFAWTAPPAGAAAIAFARQERVITPRSVIPPEYPRDYQLANYEGDVFAAYIVDTLGRVEAETLRIVHSSGELFTQTVRDFLQRVRFHPQIVDCRKQRLAVAQPFVFRLRR